MTEASPPFRIKSVDHTGITVSSLDEALPFWVGVMGFEHLYTWDFENSPFLEELVGVKGAAARVAMVKGPGHLIELLEYRAPMAARSSSQGPATSVPCMSPSTSRTSTRC